MAFYSGYGLLGSLLALALLISNTAAGLASRLARGLALAASTVLCALAKVLRLNSLDMLHNFSLQNKYFNKEIISQLLTVVKTTFEKKRRISLFF